MSADERFEDPQQIREMVSEGYTRVVEQVSSGCGGQAAADAAARKGVIEELPLEDASADVILSNCVINLFPEKQRVYAEAYRVLKPGGRLMVSDIVLERPLPEQVLRSVDAYIGCVGGAVLREEYLETVRRAGFREVRVDREACFGDTIDLDDPQIAEAMGEIEITREQARDYAKAVTSLHVFARK